jgi:hypothetical protein
MPKAHRAHANKGTARQCIAVQVDARKLGPSQQRFDCAHSHLGANGPARWSSGVMPRGDREGRYGNQ